MLLHLQIRNFAIVPGLEQEFLPGFTAISGETGAGKSILVDALGLLLGARSDASWVRDGADRAELTAEFSVSANRGARDWLRENALNDGDACLLRRTIQAGGRSRAWINGTPVTVSQLAELGNQLVEVHGQNEHVRLSTPRRQRQLLDTTGEYSDLLEATRQAFRQWQETRASYDTLHGSAALSPNEQAFLQFQIEELHQAALPAEAFATLEKRQVRLSRSGEVAATLDACQQMVDSEGEGVISRLADMGRRLDSLRDLDRHIDEVAALLGEALILLQEASTSLQAAVRSVELDPEELQRVEAQLSALHGLGRKHGVAPENLQEVLDALRDRLELAANFDAEQARMQAQLSADLTLYRESAKALSEARSQHARSLAEQVESHMHALGMPGGQFVLRVEADSQREPSEFGDDVVAIDVSANPGVAPGPIGKVASGGELSRLSLAIKVAGAGADGRTHVFDEVDTGVGGETANAVGRLLQQFARNGQALCVTHLAQVAVRADQQLQVSKQAQPDRTSVATRALGDEERIEEIARMLGGSLSEQSRAHAREMLEAARGSTH